MIGTKRMKEWQEGGGSGGIMHHWDESEWVQRREAGESRRLTMVHL